MSPNIVCRRTIISSKFDNEKFHDRPARLASPDALSVRGRFFRLIARPLSVAGRFVGSFCQCFPLFFPILRGLLS